MWFNEWWLWWRKRKNWKADEDKRLSIFNQLLIKNLYRKPRCASPGGTAGRAWRSTVWFLPSGCSANVFMTDDRSGGKWGGVVAALTTVTGLKRGEERETGWKKKTIKKKRSVFWWTYLESSVQYCLITLSKNIHFTAIQCQVLHTIHNSGEKELTMYKTHRKPEECYSHSSRSAFWRKYFSLFFSHLLTSLLWTLVLTNSAEDY